MRCRCAIIRVASSCHDCGMLRLWVSLAYLAVSSASTTTELRPSLEVAAVWAIHYTSNSDILCSTAVAVPLESTLSKTEKPTTLLRIQERRQVGQELGKLSLQNSNIHPNCPRGMDSELWLNTAIGDAFVQNIC